MLVFKLRFVNFTINEHDDDDDDDDIVFCLVTSNDEDKNTVRLDLRKHLSTVHDDRKQRLHSRD